MPPALSRFLTQRNDSLAKETVSRAMAAIIISGRQLHRQIDHSEFFVHADLAPDARVAGVLGRVVFPGFVSVLGRQRNGVENPEAFTCSRVESADIPFHVLHGLWHSARPVGSANDDGVAGNNR